MNKPVDPEQLDLGAFPQKPPESAIERAMKQYPIPSQTHDLLPLPASEPTKDELDLAFSRDVKWIDDAPPPQLDKITLAPATTIDAPTAQKQPRTWFGSKKKPPTEEPADPKKRHSLKLMALGSAGLATVAYMGHRALTAPPPFDFALLKRDNESGGLAVMHRRLSKRDESGLAEPSKSTFEGLGALTLAGDGRESLVIGPDIEAIFPERQYNGPSQDPKATVARDYENSQVAKIGRFSKNVYIPFELFAGATDFRVYIREDHIKDSTLPLGHRETREHYTKKLVISISGPYKKEDRPIGEDISQGATNAKDAVGDTLTSLKDSIIGGIDRIAEATGLGDGVDDLERRAQEQGKAIRHREGGKPHPQWRKHFALEMDCPVKRDASGKLVVDTDNLPDLHFYNGHTLDAPTAHIRREQLAEGLKPNPRTGMRLITNDGVVSDSMKNNGVREHQNVRFTDEPLRIASIEADKLKDASPENGILKDVWNGIVGLASTDNKLEDAEMGSLIMATNFQQHGYEKSLGTGYWERLGNQFEQNVTGTHQFEIGR